MTIISKPQQQNQCVISMKKMTCAWLWCFVIVVVFVIVVAASELIATQLGKSFCRSAITIPMPVHQPLPMPMPMPMPSLCVRRALFKASQKVDNKFSKTHKLATNCLYNL